MLIKYVSGNLEAYDCFHERYRLKAVGFSWRKRKKAWVKKYTPSGLEAFLQEFPKTEEYQVNQDFADLVLAHKEEIKRRNAELVKLSALKEDLFNRESFEPEGFKVPDGISPYNHQWISAKYFYESKVGNLYGDCGVGKTLIMLMLIERLKREHKISKVLVITLKNIMYGAWKKDLEKFYPELNLCILDRGTKINKKILLKDFHGHPKYRKKYDKNFDVYTINFESVHGIKDVLGKCGFDMCIIDESSKLKDPKTKITKACIEIGDLIPRKYVLSGSPAPNKELEYFGQIRFLTDSVFGDNFWSFRNRWFVPVDYFGFKYELDPLRKEEFSSLLYSYGLRFTQKDCIDLPETSIEFLPAIMSKKLSDVYEALEKEKVLEIEKKLYATDNPLSSLLKLRQLSSGFCPNPEKDGELIKFKNHKLTALTNFLENNPSEQAIIWAVFRHDLELLEEVLGDDAVGLHGGTKNAEKSIDAFTNGNAKYLIANPSSAGHGLTFTNCRVNIFYSFDYNSENYQQALARTQRAGQTRNVVYYHIMSMTRDGASTIDDVMYAAVDGKITRLMDILNLFKDKYEYKKAS